MNTPQSPLKRELSDLEKVDCKTGHMLGPGGRIYRSWSGGRSRILGGEQADYCYHVMSRTCGGEFLLGREEKEAFRKIMRRMARFSGVEILTYCIMDNHFHILARVPCREKFLRRFNDKKGEPLGSGEERLLEHLTVLYSKAYVDRVREELTWMREHKMDADAAKFMDKYKRRLCDLSLFVKEVKERFSRWYNKKHERKGTLWMDRFKSVLVENGEALRTMAAYIDLNPVRAGVVNDPMNYRWCGYAEAVAGSKQARRGLCRVMEKPIDSWSDPAQESGTWYRCWLMADGEEVTVDDGNRAYQVKAKKGMSKEKVKRELAREGRLSIYQTLRSRVRYLSEGVVIGSKGFVDSMYEKNREMFGPERKTGARRVEKNSGNNEKNEFFPGPSSDLYILKGGSGA